MERVLDYRPSPSDPRDAAWLEAECQRLDHLLAGYHLFLAHDLPNQFVALQGFALLLEDASPADAADYVARLAALTRTADQRCRRLADLGRLLREPAYGEPVALLDVLHEAVAEVNATPRQPTPPGDIRLHGPMPIVAYSRRLLHQVSVELLYNALSALPTDRPGRIDVVARRQGDGLTLDVQDTGRGIPRAVLARLGEPASSGQMLGFFFLVQLVARWRGLLTVRTEVDQGTTITLWLPDAGPVVRA